MMASMWKSKNFGQKIALVFAGLSVVAAVACIVAAVLYEPRSANDAVRSSLLASVFFFGCTGTVLFVIGTARLKGLLSADVQPQAPDRTSH
jgi:hypothetical protein